MHKPTHCLSVTMKLFFSSLLVIFLYSCTKEMQYHESIVEVSESKVQTSTATFNMLWNKDGVRKRSFIHLNLLHGIGNDNLRPAVWQMSDLSEADSVGNPYNTWPYKYKITPGSTYTNDSISSPNNTAYSFLLVTEGYQNNQFGVYPGFDVWIQNSYTNQPLEFNIFNNAKQFSEYDSVSKAYPLHEAGIIFQHWYNQWNEGRWSFTKQFNIGQLQFIKPKFQVRLDDFNNYASPNTTLTTSYLTADLRIEYRRNGNLVRTDLLGVIFSNLGGINGFDYNGNTNDDIFWEDTNPVNPRVLLHGYQLGLTPSNITAFPSIWTTIEFDYLPLVYTYLPAPPADCTYDDAILVGFDIYSSTRASDIVFSVKDIYLNGKYN